MSWTFRAVVVVSPLICLGKQVALVFTFSNFAPFDLAPSLAVLNLMHDTAWPLGAAVGTTCHDRFGSFADSTIS